MKTRPISTLHVGGDLTVDGNFTVGGNLAVGGTLTVTGASTLTGPLTVNNVGTFMNGINMKESVGGAINGQIAMSGGNMLVRTNGSFYWQNLAGSVTGAILSPAGALSLYSTLGVSGRAAFTGGDGQGIATSASGLGALEVQSNPGTGAAKISFHRPGYYAAYLGLDTDNIWKVGGWSMGAAAYRLVLGDGLNNTGSILCTGNVQAGSALYAGTGNVYLPDGNCYIVGSAQNLYFRAASFQFQNTSGGYIAVNAGSFNAQAAGHILTCVSTNNTMYWDNSTLSQWSTLGGLFRHYVTSGPNAGYYFDIQPQSSGFMRTGGNAPSIQLPATGNQLAWTNGSYISGNAGYVQGSQSLLKEHMTRVSDAQCLARVADPGMPVMSYSWPEDKRQSLGFAAEDVHRVLPQSTIRRADQTPTGYVAQELTTVLWGAVRELNKRVEALEAAA